MTDAELEGFAAQALNMAWRDIEQRNDFNFLLASYHAEDVPPIHRMTKVERLIVSKLGEEWLNSGRTKDVGFLILRHAVAILPPPAIVFVTAANGFKPTDKFGALPEAQRLEIMNAGHDRHHQLVKEGLLEMHDVLVAVAQTPTRVCNCMQRYDRGKRVGNRETQFSPQENFDGRLKMYG